MNRRYGNFRAQVNRRSVLLALAGSALAPAAVAQGGNDRTIRIAMLGDSLTAGYGLRGDEALPVRLERRLKAAGLPVAVANHGVSGDTTEGGLQRLDWMLADMPDIVIVALGANDALRGLDPQRAERNLDEIVTRLRARRIEVLLAGMMAPRNFGAAYTVAFDGLYSRLAQKHGVTLYPFLLDGVAMDPQLNQADGIHPTARGVDTIVERILPSVQATIEKWRNDTSRRAG